jgi:glycosyltransferase involved in cell wall biosynthesis
MSDLDAAPSLSVVVFAYDEAENVPAVLTELRDWLALHEPDAEVVFVDDGSRDGTGEAAARTLARSRHRLLRHDTNRGIGAGLKTGVAAARAPWVTFLPADGQIAPDAIGILREASRAPGVEVVLSVYRDRDDGLDRKLLSWGMRALVRLVHGIRLESDGPYLFRRELFDPDVLVPDSFFLNVEFPIRMLAAKRGVRVVEISCRPRAGGASKSARVRTVVRIARDLVEFRVRRARGR